MVDLAFLILKAANTPFYYRDLMAEVAKLRGMSEEEINDTIAQLYTEINIDGRFACVGTNLWGLKRWYPLERSDDPIGNSSVRASLMMKTMIWTMTISPRRKTPTPAMTKTST